jgi:hypothetical protein
LEFDNDYLKKEVAKISGQLQQAEAMMQNKDLYGKIKQEGEEKAKEEHRKLQG